jgi:ATP-dependent Clp protease protease subunit
MSLRVPLYGRRGPFVGPWTLFANKARVVTLFGPIHSSMSLQMSLESVPLLAENVAGAILYLAQRGSDPIKILINSPGGDVTAGFQIIQAIEHVQAKGIEVWTINQGMTASMASIILSCGTKGKRFAFSRSNTHFHAETSTIQGKGIERDQMEEFAKRLRKSLHKLLLDQTQLPEFYARQTEAPSEDLTDSRRDRLLDQFLQGEPVLSSEEALNAHVIDAVLAPGDACIDDIFLLSDDDEYPPKPKKGGA